ALEGTQHGGDGGPDLVLPRPVGVLVGVVGGVADHLGPHLERRQEALVLAVEDGVELLRRHPGRGTDVGHVGAVEASVADFVHEGVEDPRPLDGGDLLPELPVASPRNLPVVVKRIPTTGKHGTWRESARRTGARWSGVGRYCIVVLVVHVIAHFGNLPIFGSGSLWAASHPGAPSGRTASWDRPTMTRAHTSRARRHDHRRWCRPTAAPLLSTNRERPPTSRRVSGSSPAAELPAPCPRGLAVTRFPSSRGRRPVRSVRPAKPAAALRTLSLMAASSLAATVQMASSEFALLDCLGIRVAAGVPTAMCPLNAQPLQLSSDFPGKSKTPGQGRKIEAGRSHDSEANVA